MKRKPTDHITRKINRLEKLYESIPPAAILRRQKIEAKMRKLLEADKILKGYKK